MMPRGNCTTTGRTVLTIRLQLQLLVKPGDRVSVTDTSSQSTMGNIGELSKSSMRLLVNGATRTFSESEVLEIKRRTFEAWAVPPEALHEKP